METLCVTLPSEKPIMDTPVLLAPTYIRQSSEKRGFGVFAAVDIDPSQFADPSSCIATYGGVVCTEWEPRCKEETYSLPFGSLQRTLPPPAPGTVEQYVLNDVFIYVITQDG